MARDPSRKRARVGTGTDCKPADNTNEIAKDLYAAFEQIKEVNGVYQREITPCEAPDIYMYDGIGIVGLPLGEKQAREMVDAAQEGEFNVFDADATSLSEEPACFFNAGIFDIQNPRWDGYVQDLATSAAGAFALDDCEVKAEMHSLCLWTENCVWSTPSHT